MINEYISIQIPLPFFSSLNLLIQVCAAWQIGILAFSALNLDLFSDFPNPTCDKTPAGQRPHRRAGRFMGGAWQEREVCRRREVLAQKAARKRYCRTKQDKATTQAVVAPCSESFRGPELVYYIHVGGAFGRGQGSTCFLGTLF